MIEGVFSELQRRWFETGAPEAERLYREELRQNRATVLREEVEFDFAAFRLLAKEASRAAFTQIRGDYPGSEICAYAMYTNDGVETLCPSASSHANLKRSEPWQEWQPAEWAYEAHGFEHYRLPCSMLRSAEDLLETDLGEAFASSVLESCVRALEDLIVERFFGSEAERDNLVILFSVSDSNTSHRDWVKRLNTEAVYRRYEAFVQS